jgi:phosphoketolase
MDKNEAQTAATGGTLPDLARQNAELERQLAKQAKEIDLLTTYCKELMAENRSLKTILNPQEGMAGGYDTRWHWYKKITWALKAADRPLLSQELIARLQQMDENLRHNTNPVGFLSAYLTNAVKRKLIDRHKQPGTRGYYYCLPHWMKDGVLELQYHTLLY